jgi:hypothetical protein
VHPGTVPQPVVISLWVPTRKVDVALTTSALLERMKNVTSPLPSTGTVGLADHGPDRLVATSNEAPE